jgi:hypothetical protein
MTQQYQDWGNSRWQFTRSRSAWHFDPSRPAEPGADSFTAVCRFSADFSAAIAHCMPQANPATWGNRNADRVQGKLYSAPLEEADLIRAGADPQMEIYHRGPADDVAEFQWINTWLGMEDSMIKFHNQTTGQMLVTHIDNFAARKERENSFRETDMDADPAIMRRFAIMLADWQLGQVFQLGNATWTQWRAGDCITWEWPDIPHATCNMGWWDRPMLQITGRVTDRTRTVLSSAQAHRIVPLP